MLKVLTKEIIINPKAVIFDTDNTLYPYDIAHSAAIDAVKKKSKNTLGISEKEFSKAYELARKDIKLQLGETASSHSRLLYFQKTIESLGLRTRILVTLFRADLLENVLNKCKIIFVCKRVYFRVEERWRFDGKHY